MLEEKSLFRFFDKGHWLNSNNLWEPKADEFAVAFRLDELRGILNTRLEIGPGTRVWALIDGKPVESQEGSLHLENFVEIVNSAIDRKQGHVLITRYAALPVPFEFSGIRSFDSKEMDVALSLTIGVGDLASFRNHFMLSSGPLTVAHLQSLLDPTVEQAVREFCTTRSLCDLKVTTELRGQLIALIRNEMRKQFDEYGLEFEGVPTLRIDHKKSASEHQSDAERETLRERARMLAQLEIILRADTQEKAIFAGASEEILALIHQQTIAQIQREKEILKERGIAEDDATNWRHTQALAAILHRNEREAAEARAKQERQWGEARFEAQLEMFEAEESIRRAERLEDAEERKAEKRKATARRDAAATRLEQIEEARSKRAEQIEEARTKLALTEIEIAIRQAEFDAKVCQMVVLADIPLPPVSSNPVPEPTAKPNIADSKQPGSAQGPGTSTPNTAGAVTSVSQSHLVDQHFTIKEGEQGHSYESIIGPYLTDATSLEIDDPYIRKSYQRRNFREFCDLVVLSNTVKKITLTTTYEDKDYEDSISQFERIKRDLAKKGVGLEVELKPDKAFHHREIRVDNGWSIRIDKGLDIFKPFDSKSAAQLTDQKLRQCELRQVSIFHRDGIGQRGRSASNSNNSDIPLTLHVMRHRPLVIGQKTTLSFWVRNDTEAELENVTVTLKGDDRLTATPNACDHVVCPGKMAECHVVLQSNGPAGEIALKVSVEAEARNGGCVLAVATSPLNLLIRKEGTRGSLKVGGLAVVNTLNFGSNDVTFEEGARIGTISAGADDGRVIPEVGVEPTTENSAEIPLKRREPRGLGSRINLREFAADWPHKQGEHLLSLAFVDDHGEPRKGPVRTIGDKYILRARATTPAYLWLFGQSSDGTFQHLFPTKQASVQGGIILAGLDSKYPGDLSGTEPHRINGVTTDVLGFNDRGTERAVAVCTNQPLDIPGEWKRIEEIPPEKVRRLLTQAYNQAGSVLAMVDIQVVPG